MVDLAKREDLGNGFARPTAYLPAVFVGILTPLLLLGFVPVLRRLAHGAPGGSVGFRTALSTSSVENWQLAQALAADQFLVIGLASLALACLSFAMLRMLGKARVKTWWIVATVLVAVQIAALTIGAVVIDQHLRLHTPGTLDVAPVVQTDSLNSEHAMAFVFAIAVPLLLIVLYPAMRHAANAGRNSLFGFRTSVAYQSDDHWRSAQLISGRMYLIAGIVILLAMSAVYGVLLATGKLDNSTWWNLSLVGAFVPIAIMLGTIPSVHRKVLQRSTDDLLQ